MSITLSCIAVIIIGYAFGCFSTGYFVGKRKGMDIRDTGSGNIGTTNALRSMGAAAGAITFAGDLLKAFLPTLLVKYVYCPYMGYEADVTYLITLVTGLGVVVGHNFPVTLKFKGGKGIAVSAAVIIVSTTDPIFIGIGLLIFILAVLISKYVSVGSLIVVWYFPIFSTMHYRASVYFIPIIIVSLVLTELAYFKHRGNINRLIHGTENKLTFKKTKDA